MIYTPIYCTARRVGTVTQVTVTQLYLRGVDFVDGQMQTQIASRIQKKADDMVKEAEKEMNSQISTLLRTLIAAKKEEIDTEMAKAQQNVAATLTQSLLQAKDQVNNLVEKTEKEIKIKISEMEEAIENDADAASKRVKQIRNAVLAQADVKPVGSEITKSCDPNYLDVTQITRVGVRQLSEGTGKIVRNGLEVFKNTFYLDVRTTDETTDAAEPSCILDAVDRVVYGADPKWYKPAEFVRIDRENEYRLTISGWGPTELSAEVYFIGRRDPLLIEGNLTMTKVTRADKRFLGKPPQD